MNQAKFLYKEDVAIRMGHLTQTLNNHFLKKGELPSPLRRSGWKESSILIHFMGTELAVTFPFIPILNMKK